MYDAMSQCPWTMIGIDSLAAPFALKAVNQANTALSRTMNEVATGKRVATAEDDPADYVNALRLASEASALAAVNLNLANAGVPTQVANAALTNITGVLNTLQQQVIEAQSAGSVQPDIDTQIQGLLAEISNNISDATVNGTNLIAGGDSGDVARTQIKVPSGLNGQMVTIGDQGVSAMNASVAGLGLDGFTSSSGGLSVQFPSVSAGNFTTSTQVVLQTANYGNSSGELPQYPGQQWTFQFTDAKAPVAASQSPTATDANGNVLEQDNVIPVPLRAGFTLNDAMSALQAALSGAGFVSQISYQPVLSQNGTVSLTLNIAGNNVNPNAASTETVQNLVPNAQDTFAQVGVQTTAATLPGASTLKLTTLALPSGAGFPSWSGAQYLSTSAELQSFQTSNPTGPAFYLPGPSGPIGTAGIQEGTTLSAVQPTANTADLSQPVTQRIPAGQRVVLVMPLAPAVIDTPWTGVAASIATIGAAIQKVGSMGQTLGAAQNLLGQLQTSTSDTIDALNGGVGTMTDADLDKVSALLQAQQIQQRLADQALSLSNRSASLLLQLFK
jgi:flagellin